MAEETNPLAAAALGGKIKFDESDRSIDIQRDVPKNNIIQYCPQANIENYVLLQPLARKEKNPLSLKKCFL